MKTMTPSQIDKILENFRAVLRKHEYEFESGAVQTILGNKQLGQKLLAVIREQTKVVSGIITRRAKVDLTRSPQDCLKATGRNLYANDEVVANMTKGKSGEANVVFFKSDRCMSDDQLEKEYEKQGLVPVDPYSLSAINEADPFFADKYPNGTHWKDSDGMWCSAAFSRWNGGWIVDVDRINIGWYGPWWFGGLRK